VEATLDSLALGFSVAFRPDVQLYAFLGCLVGTLVGILPGIGPLAGISILLPVTFGLDAIGNRIHPQGLAGKLAQAEAWRRTGMTPAVEPSRSRWQRQPWANVPPPTVQGRAMQYSAAASK